NRGGRQSGAADRSGIAVEAGADTLVGRAAAEVRSALEVHADRRPGVCRVVHLSRARARSGAGSGGAAVGGAAVREVLERNAPVGGRQGARALGEGRCAGGEGQLDVESRRLRAVVPARGAISRHRIVLVRTHAVDDPDGTIDGAVLTLLRAAVARTVGAS